LRDPPPQSSTSRRWCPRPIAMAQSIGRRTLSRAELRHACCSSVVALPSVRLAWAAPPPPSPHKRESNQKAGCLCELETKRGSSTPILPELGHWHARPGTCPGRGGHKRERGGVSGDDAPLSQPSSSPSHRLSPLHPAERFLLRFPPPPQSKMAGELPGQARQRMARGTRWATADARVFAWVWVCVCACKSHLAVGGGRFVSRRRRPDGRGPERQRRAMAPTLPVAASCLACLSPLACRVVRAPTRRRVARPLD
jgi:hypothetical protein